MSRTLHLNLHGAMLIRGALVQLYASMRTEQGRERERESTWATITAMEMQGSTRGPDRHHQAHAHPMRPRINSGLVGLVDEEKLLFSSCGVPWSSKRPQVAPWKWETPAVHCNISAGGDGL